MSKDILRGKILSSKNFKIREFEVEAEGEVVKVGIKSVSIEKRNKILAKLRMEAEGVKSLSLDELANIRIDALIACAVDLESGDNLFNDRDRQVILSQAANGCLEKIAEECFKEVLGNAEDAKKK